MEASQELQKMGDVVSYRVVTVEARGENDPDLYLVVTTRTGQRRMGRPPSRRDAKMTEGSVEPPTRA